MTKFVIDRRYSKRVFSIAYRQELILTLGGCYSMLPIENERGIIVKQTNEIRPISEMKRPYWYYEDYFDPNRSKYAEFCSYDMQEETIIVLLDPIDIYLDICLPNNKSRHVRHSELCVLRDFLISDDYNQAEIDNSRQEYYKKKSRKTISALGLRLL